MDIPVVLAERAPAPDPCTPAITAVLSVIARHSDASGTPIRGALMPILHDVQHTLGYIPPDTVATIAQALNLSRAEVHGVITFYPHFHLTPQANHVVEICMAESCQAMGSDALVRHAEDKLGCTMHTQRSDGHYALMPVYCLGLCAQSPNIMIDGRPVATVTPARFDRVLARLSESHTQGEPA